MKIKPNVLILKTDGINCDEELTFAFQGAGGNPKTVHITELRSNKESLEKFQILAIPGGFSYGDDIVSGKILALELTSFFSDALKTFIERKDTLIIGICNGFQVLMRTGLLPNRHMGYMEATLMHNKSGNFECRWVDVKVDHKNSCVFLQDMKDRVVSFQIAHGEGRFYAQQYVIDKIENKHLVALRYHGDNPNGSVNDIAGITDSTGRILGLMPHPERFTLKEQYPNWRRADIREPFGSPIFKNMIMYLNSV